MISNCSLTNNYHQIFWRTQIKVIQIQIFALDVVALHALHTFKKERKKFQTRLLQIIAHGKIIAC